MYEAFQNIENPIIPWMAQIEHKMGWNEMWQLKPDPAPTVTELVVQVYSMLAWLQGMTLVRWFIYLRSFDFCKIKTNWQIE